MDVVFFGIFLVLLTAFVARPLYAHAHTGPARPDTPDARHEESLVIALRELEVDRASGLITEEAYEAERSALEQRPTD